MMFNWYWLRTFWDKKIVFWLVMAFDYLVIGTQIMRIKLIDID